MTSALFDTSRDAELVLLLQKAHAHLAQLGQMKRSSRAKNYDSSLRALGVYMDAQGEKLPSRLVVEAWRDSMLLEGKAIRTVNARLSAVRQLLKLVALETIDLQLKVVLADWASIPAVKETHIQDSTDADYGVRLSLNELAQLVNSIDTSHLKGLRDRALIALMAGCGLRVSETVVLTLRDVFLTQNETGQRGVRVARGKHNKTRVVVYGGWSSWVIEAVQAYTNALNLTPLETPDAIIFRAVKLLKDGVYIAGADKLSVRTAQRAVEEHGLNAHDLRRTYAKLCKTSGMAWEALRENLGHSSVKTTERYVGVDVDWSERIPNWKVKLNS